jgi:ribonucleoside-triphosphate reductase (formate)
MKNVVKRDERIEPFDNEKIINAIKKANLEVDDNERLNDRQIDYIISIINDMGEQDTVENIQDAVEKGII